MKEELEKKLISSQMEMREEEEHSHHMLTLWEKVLKLLEDWLSNPGIEEDCLRDVVVKNEEEFQPEKQLENIEFFSA
jgi:hypothetical protein